MTGPFIAVDGRQFLEYDTRGDGRAVEAVGDLARATRIAIVIPGVDTTVANFDHGLGNIERRAPAFQARQLYGAMSARTSEPVAVVAWLGYNPPEGVGLAAVREDRAAAGARALVSFVDTLTAAHPAAAITVIGHSYGSVVAGLAAPRLGPNVHDIIAIGSPGMGVDKRADLHTDGPRSGPARPRATGRAGSPASGSSVSATARGRPNPSSARCRCRSAAWPTTTATS